MNHLPYILSLLVDELGDREGYGLEIWSLVTSGRRESPPDFFDAPSLSGVVPLACAHAHPARPFIRSQTERPT